MEELQWKPEEILSGPEVNGVLSEDGKVQHSSKSCLNGNAVLVGNEIKTGDNTLVITNGIENNVESKDKPLLEDETFVEENSMVVKSDVGSNSSHPAEEGIGSFEKLGLAGPGSKTSMQKENKAVTSKGSVAEFEVTKESELDLTDSDITSTLSSSSSDESEKVEYFKANSKKVNTTSGAQTGNSIAKNTEGNSAAESKDDTTESKMIEDLNNELALAHTECEKGNKMATCAEEERENMEKKLSSVMTANEQLKENSEKLKSINDRLQDELARTSKELEKNNSLLDERGKTISDLREEIAGSQEDKDLLDSRALDTRTELDEAKSLLQNKEKTAKELQEQLESLHAKSKEQEVKINKLEDELDAAKDELGKVGQEKSLTESQLQDDLEKAKYELLEGNQDKSKLESLQAKSEEQEVKISKLEDELGAVKDELGKVGQEKSFTESQLQDELEKAKYEVRKGNQDKSKLEAKLSNSQTLTEQADTESQKLREEIKSLKDKIKWLEKKRSSEKSNLAMSTPRSETQSTARSETQSQAELLDKKLSSEVQRRMQERVRELQQKVIQLNEEKQKLKNDYDESVKALEAVDKVYSVREMALQKYRTELDEANEKLKQDSSEIDHLKHELSLLNNELRKAEEDKAETKTIKEQIARVKENATMYKEELDDVRKDLSDQVHEVNMAQTKARERGKKIQMLDLELREVKDTLSISKNIIEEKERNMTSLKATLNAEKEKCTKLERHVEELTFVKKKLGFVEEDKARVDKKLKLKEQELKDSQENLKSITSKYKEQGNMLDTLDKDHKKLKRKCEDHEQEIRVLKQMIDTKESIIEEQLIESIHLRGQVDDLNVQLNELWASYSADKAWWKHRAGRTLRRRPKSAPPKRFNQAAPPPVPSPHPEAHSLYHRRLVNKLGMPIINPNFINTQHKAIPRKEPLAESQASQEDGGSPLQRDQPKDKEDSPVSTQEPRESNPRLSPRPPDSEINRTKQRRPMSSYGIRTYPPVGGGYDPGRGYYSDAEMDQDVWMEDGSLSSGDSEEQMVKHVVHKGDRVMIQSKIVGDDKVNVSGVVKYVGKVGKKTVTSSVYVGLKLDQPFGDNSGLVAGKRYFKCQPKHGKMVKMSDIHAVMHPRTHNYERVKPMTVDW